MIKANKLTMHYGPVVALRDVSFEVNRGEIVGLLGPNGAGKSTAMKILTTYLHPTSGTAQVGGIDVLDNPLGVRRIIGYLPEILPLYMDMEVRTYLDFVGRARGLSGGKLKQRVEVVLDECGLRPMYRKIIRELSKGYKQRTGLAQALIHDPDIIVLDEPTSGLDPHQIVEIRQLIRKLAATKTVILSTHILQEVEAMADRIVIINRGRTVGDGTIEELRARARDFDRTAISLQGDRAEIERMLSGMDGVRKVHYEGEVDGCCSFTVYSRIGSEIWRELNKLAHSKNWAVRELAVKPLTLEETFLTLTEPAKKRDEKEGAAA
ncbi:MAG TPA: ATP-binding cassette domain-containing protein [Candidatus Hydrogenedentes bacterium]|nr:ATP-binding cassette domain-containing protein [Candidatus Hydrogenedentota bacterium]HOV72903.1 ATP-binding cassette domain-containing protein [Candidatus Hydrogenedentota bacterium]HPC18219.1 ATP-binding cassette domain-containing protein [Candidatus Hydrogenedentota bacterium]HRT21870.1 ATP-binding cassette domain-containing protein [Candidatus Hydrogenedentota bacterium]HRT66612.1 ATP-binding cassette domain-containing protein [Candidatus Hydrogenedentota bacterium]